MALGGENIDADIVIRNVEIHDGRGQPATRGDIAVKGEQIVAVGEFDVAGRPRLIDGSSLVAAPGFIDLHTHSDSKINNPTTRLNKNYLTQGVTTIVTGNCGGGILAVGDYLDDIDREGAGSNVAHLIPQGSLRRSVLGSARRTPTPNELDRMKELVEQGMRAGAWGMSTGLIYVPSSFAETDELVELARVVQKHGGIYVSHIRNEGTGLLDAIDEALTIGRQADIPVHVSHFKASGRDAWGLAAAAIRRIEEARDSGRIVTADQYPYVASSTSLGAMVVPSEYRSNKSLIAALADPETAEQVRQQIAARIEARNRGKSLFIASYPKNPRWQGMDLASLADKQQRPVLELVLEIQRSGGAQMVNFAMQEEEVRQIMQQPFVATASDGSARGVDNTVPHPRNYGTFPRKIGHYAIQQGTISLEWAIRSSSGLPADIFGFQQRGYLRTGYFADIVVFDPETFRDKATFEKPHQYSTGVRYLLVNGKLAIDKGQVTNVLGGRALRHQSEL
jgi:N-acyl-D-aspartate/D-glutamate deacylase